LTDLLTIFSHNILPILLAAGTGFILSSFLHLDARPISQIIFYILSPCLIFDLITKNRLSDGDILRVILLAWSAALVLGLLTFFVGKLLKFERNTMAGVLLGSMFMNAGNYGLPVVLFAFGAIALSYASIYFVAGIVLSYTVGVIIASMGKSNFRQALLNLIRIPTLYALFLAVGVIRLNWVIPLPVDRTITLLGQAAIPMMLILLGLQLRSVKLRFAVKPIAVASTMRLLVSPLLVVLLVSIFHLTGLAQKALIIEAAMPTAVFATVLATEYDSEPSLVTATVFITTLLSPISLTLLLDMLGA